MILPKFEEFNNTMLHQVGEQSLEWILAETAFHLNQ
jgi:hypothetical protein